MRGSPRPRGRPSCRGRLIYALTHPLLTPLPDLSPGRLWYRLKKVLILMAIRVKSRGGESVEGLMRRFKKLCEKEGLTKDIKRKEFYEKPSERRRRAARKSQVRRIKTELGPLAKPAKPDKRD
jgi:small subunit ribosomal protein S21